MMHYQSLKLDSTFRPIEVVDARDALVMVLLGKAIIVETYDNLKLCTIEETYYLEIIILVNIAIANFQPIN